MEVLFAITLFGLLGAGASLVLGLLAMSAGGATDLKFGTPLMWWRVAFQGLAALVLLGLLALQRV
jgi:hypothetical protein